MAACNYRNTRPYSKKNTSGFQIISGHFEDHLQMKSNFEIMILTSILSRPMKMPSNQERGTLKANLAVISPLKRAGKNIPGLEIYSCTYS